MGSIADWGADRDAEARDEQFVELARKAVKGNAGINVVRLVLSLCASMEKTQQTQNTWHDINALKKAVHYDEIRRL